MQEMQGRGFNPWVGKVSWRRKWPPTLVLLPERQVAWWATVHGVGNKELDMAEQLSTHLCKLGPQALWLLCCAEARVDLGAAQ